MHFLFFYPPPQFPFPTPGYGGSDCACAFLGLRIINVPIAVSAAYFPIFFMASFLLISLVFSEPAQLTLYNVLGIKILSKNIQNPSQKEMLSTVGMKTGVYIIKVQAENIVFTKKLIIE